MISLVLEFYIPAFLITLLISLVFSVVYTLFFFAGKTSRQIGQGQRFFHELFILDLLTIPVLSFAVLAIIVVVQSIHI